MCSSFTLIVVGALKEGLAGAVGAVLVFQYLLFSFV